MKTNMYTTLSYGLLYIDTPVLADQQILSFISFVQTLDAEQKTYRER